MVELSAWKAIKCKMPNKRKKGLMLIGYFGKRSENDKLVEIAKQAGFKSKAEYIRWVIETAPAPKRKAEN